MALCGDAGPVGGSAGTAKGGCRPRGGRLGPPEVLAGIAKAPTRSRAPAESCRWWCTTPRHSAWCRRPPPRHPAGRLPAGAGAARLPVRGAVRGAWPRRRRGGCRGRRGTAGGGAGGVAARADRRARPGGADARHRAALGGGAARRRADRGAPQPAAPAGGGGARARGDRRARRRNLRARRRGVPDRLARSSSGRSCSRSSASRASGAARLATRPTRACCRRSAPST